MLEFRLLGPLEVWRDGARVAIEAARERAVLAALLLQANRVVAANRLIDLLWGDEDVPAKARNAVHTWVWRLRRRLEPPQVFVTQPPGYLLRIEPEQLDLCVFERLLQRGRQALADGAAAEASDLLGAASRLWRGQPLADVAAPRLREVEGSRLAELHLQAMKTRVEADLAVGRHAELVGELRGLVADHPLSEELCGHLMTALYRSGRQAEALATFRLQRGVLAEQLGVEPGPALQRLHQAILNADPDLDLRPLAATAVAPPGAPAVLAPAAAEPPAPPRRAPAQLPAAVSAFTGRTRYLEQLDRLLTTDVETTAVPICTIAGTAGVGKTALAVHWAHRVRERFPDGQLYVNLRGYDLRQPVAPIEALGQFLRALGVAPDRIPATREEAAGMYRSLLADRRVLVVLDNAGSTEQVRPLLPGSAGCLVLVTSRDRLAGLVARDGAHRMSIDVLSPPEAIALLERIIGHRRARAEPIAAAELAEECGYLALALRIAAASLVNHPHDTMASLVAELRAGDRLTMLRIDDDEQSAVRVAFDQSYATLPADARRLFRLLGLVPGVDFTVETAGRLLDSEPAQARRVLDRLEAAHLIESNTPGRYTFHDLLRLYSRDRVEAEDDDTERAAAVERLYDWYLRRADAAAMVLYPDMLRLPGAGPNGEPPKSDAPPAGPAARAEVLTWLDAERANLVSAVVRAAEAGPAMTACLLADSLRGYFWARRHTLDWLTVAYTAREAAQAAGNLAAMASAELSLGLVHRSLNRYAEALEHNRRSMELCERAGWQDGLAAAMNNLGAVHVTAGQLNQAKEVLEAALELTEWQSIRRENCLCNLGLICLRLGRLGEAEAHLVEALNLSREVPDKRGEAEIRQDLADTYYCQGRFELALEHLAAALTLFQENGSLDGEAMARCVLASVHRDAGRYSRALEQVQLALTLVDRTGDRYTEGVARNRLGGVLTCLGNSREAVDHHRQALQLARESDGRRPEAEALIGLATALRHLRRTDEALIHAHQGVTTARQLGFRILEGQALTVLADIRLAAGDDVLAAEQARLALDITQPAGHRLGAARALILLGHAVGGPAALEHWHTALDLVEEIGVPEAAQLRALLAGGGKRLESTDQPGPRGPARRPRPTAEHR